MTLFEDPDYFLDEDGHFSEKLFWQQKVRWAENGDCTPDGAHCLRIGGEHYTAIPGIHPRRGMMGHGGAKMTWRSLATGDILTSNDVWYQGKIPAELGLADNAEWVS